MQLASQLANQIWPKNPTALSKLAQNMDELSQKLATVEKVHTCPGTTSHSSNFAIHHVIKSGQRVRGLRCPNEHKTWMD